MIQAMIQQYIRDCTTLHGVIAESKKSVQYHPFRSRNFAVLPPNEGFGTAYSVIFCSVFMYTFTGPTEPGFSQGFFSILSLMEFWFLAAVASGLLSWTLNFSNIVDLIAQILFKLN